MMSLMTSKNPIIQITLLLDSGLVLHDQYFGEKTILEKKNQDSDLYGGFIAGILAFSAELGSELTSIKREDDSIYLFRKNNLIFVLRASSEMTKEEAHSFFQLMMKNQAFRDLLTLAAHLILVDEKTKTIAKKLVEDTHSQFITERTKKHKIVRDLWFDIDD